MPNIPKIKIGGTEYDVKDSSARDRITKLEDLGTIFVRCANIDSGKQNTNTTLNVSIVKERFFDMSFIKPSGYVYMSPFLGLYSAIGDDAFVVSVENTGDTDIDTLELQLSSGSTWGSAPPHITSMPYIAIPAGGKFVSDVIIPSEYASKYTYSYPNGVFLICRFDNQDNYKNISVRVSITRNTPNAHAAHFSEYARNAGGEYLDEIITPYPFTNNSGTYNSWRCENNYHMVDCKPASTTGQAFGSISWNIKSLFGKGVKLVIDIINKNGKASASDWFFSDWYLSRLNNNWADKILTISPSNYGADLSAKRSKMIIDIDEDFASVDYENEPVVYLLVGAFKNNPNVSNSNELGIKISYYKDESLIIADTLKGFNKGLYYSKKELNDVMDTPIPTVDMAFWGDSITAGAGGGGTTYCAVCANLLGKTHGNFGVGGESVQTIAARQGGNNLIIPAGSVNGNYSFAEMLDERGRRILPLIQGGNNTVNPVMINGQSCTLSLSGETYTIAGYSGTLLNDTPALFAGSQKYGDITVIFAGHNEISAITVEERISYIRSMISRVGKKYVVMGLISGNDNSMNGDDAAMRSAFGNHFFPARKLLVKNGLAVAGITPTAQDNTDISSGTVPTSLRSDHIHLNADGYTALGKILASFIVGLGYAEYAE